MSTLQADPREIERSLRLFVEPDGIGEIRIISKSGHTSGFYFAHAEIPQAAHKVATQFRNAKGVYVVMNRITSTLNVERLKVDCKLTKNGDIERRCWLLVDFDPKRPTETSATDAEKESARERMEAAYEWLRERGCPEAIAADSGNGWHLLFRVDLATDSDLIERFLKAFAKKFSDSFVGVDTSVHNAGRITKAYGTAALTCPPIPSPVAG